MVLFFSSFLAFAAFFIAEWKFGANIKAKFLLFNDSSTSLEFRFILISKTSNTSADPDFDLLLGGISLAGAVFLLRIGWLSLKTAPIIPGEGEVRPHSIGTRMMTNYFNPSMYLFWFTVGAPFLVRSSRTDFWPGIVFTLSFYVSIIGAKTLVALGISRSSRLTEGIWYPRIMKLLGIFLMGFSLVFVKDGLGYFGLI